MSQRDFMISNFQPINQICFLSILNYVCSDSLTIVNKKEEIGSPYMIPFSTSKGSLGEPFTPLEIEALLPPTH